MSTTSSALRLPLALAVGALLAQAAGAGIINWEGGQGSGGSIDNWTIAANWSPDWGSGGAGPGDQAVIGDGTNAFTCIADGQLAGGNPGSILVKDKALFQVRDNTDIFASGPAVEITVQSGGIIRSRRWTSGLTEAKVIFQDGAIGRIQDGGTLGSRTCPNWVIASGDVTIEEGDDDPATNPWRATFAARVEGSGNLHFKPTASGMQMQFGGGNVDYTGDIYIEQGEVRLSRDTSAGLATQGDIIIRPGAAFVISFRVHELQAFTGVTSANQGTIDPASVTTTLWIEGTGAGKGLLLYNDTGSTGKDTLYGMVLGGVAVPAGVYTTSQLDALFPGYIVTQTSAGDPVDYTFNVLHTIDLTQPPGGDEIPEPASCLLLGLGALALWRRRGRR